MNVKKTRNKHLLVSKFYSDYDSISELSYSDTFKMAKNALYKKHHNKFYFLFDSNTNNGQRVIYTDPKDTLSPVIWIFYYSNTYQVRGTKIYRFSLYNNDGSDSEHKYYFTFEHGFIQMNRLSIRGGDNDRLSKYIKVGKTRDTFDFKPDLRIFDPFD